jgi:hypothetical protein
LNINPFTATWQAITGLQKRSEWFGTILGVKNDLKGGKFDKKLLLSIKVPGFSYLFHHKNCANFHSFYSIKV